MSVSAPATRQSPPCVHRAAPLAGLLVMALALALQLAAARPPAPLPLTAPEEAFSAARALALVERLLGDGAPHPTGSEANAAVRDRIIAELTALGYAAETQAAFSCSQIWPICGTVENVLARLPGERDGPAVMLAAHYDSVPAGPGAADDMAGVATVLEIARILAAGTPPGNPVIFLLTDGEEPGLLGAEAFTAAHPWADSVGVVVNLEARGTSGPSILFETAGDNSQLVAAFLDHAPRPVVSSLYDTLYEFLPNNTDLTVFAAAGLPGINFGFIEEDAHYHTPLDNLANLDPGSVQHQGDNALAAVRAYGALDLARLPAGNRVSLDLLPGAIVHWPEPWTLGLAAACLLLWAGLAITLLRRRETSGRALLSGLVVLPAGVLGAAVLGLGLVLGVSALSGAAEPWYAQPLPLRAAVWAGALLVVALLATAVARRAGYWGLSLGVWLWWALLSLLTAAFVPGFSAMFLVPTGLTLVTLALVAFTRLRLRRGALEVAAAVALFGASSLWLLFALGAETGAGVELGALAGFGVGLASSALAPLLAVPATEPRLRRVLLAGAALLLLAAAATALGVAPYSEERPQRLNLIYLADGESGAAHWLVEQTALSGSASMAVPGALRQAANFSDEPAALLPWSDRQYPAAPAPPAGMPPPEVRLLGSDDVAGELVLQVELRSPRGASRLALYIPEAYGLSRITIPGTRHILAADAARGGYHSFSCIGGACDGLQLALHLQQRGPATLLVVDATQGLPPGGEALIEARPATAAPSHGGDITLIARQVQLGDNP
jgi:hypothetical protein